MSSVLSDTVVYMRYTINEKIKAYNYVSEALARAYKLHVYDFFFYMSVHLGACPPPPHTKKLATLLCQLFAHQKSGQMKMADSSPPHSLHEIAATELVDTERFFRTFL